MVQSVTPHSVTQVEEGGKNELCVLASDGAAVADHY